MKESFGTGPTCWPLQMNIWLRGTVPQVIASNTYVGCWVQISQTGQHVVTPSVSYSPQMVCVTVRYLASACWHVPLLCWRCLNKGTICRTIRNVTLALKRSLVHIFITFCGHRRPLHIKEEFYKSGVNMNYKSQQKSVKTATVGNSLVCVTAFPNVIVTVDCTYVNQTWERD